MKNYLIIATAALLMTGCNQDEIDRSRAALDKSKHEVDSLRAYVLTRENSISDFVTYFNDVERNLDSITIKQNIIIENSGKSVELQKSKRERINKEIAAINSLMNENYLMIGELNKKLKGAGYKNAQLEKTIAMMNGQLEDKEQELANLNEQLNLLNGEIAELQSNVGSLTVANDLQTAALHTAFYVIGKSKELQGSKIIDREGGLLGIGKISKLNEDVDKSKFTQIDYTKMSTIPVNGDDVKIVTTHPSDSYKLDTDAKDEDMVKNIIIIDPEKFWSASKYLVIVKK